MVDLNKITSLYKIFSLTNKCNLATYSFINDAKTLSIITSRNKYGYHLTTQIGHVTKVTRAERHYLRMCAVLKLRGNLQIFNTMK